MLNGLWALLKSHGGELLFCSSLVLFLLFLELLWEVPDEGISRTRAVPDRDCETQVHCCENCELKIEIKLD